MSCTEHTLSHRTHHHSYYSTLQFSPQHIL
jgi:hypothetical protein